MIVSFFGVFRLYSKRTLAYLLLLFFKDSDRKIYEFRGFGLFEDVFLWAVSHLKHFRWSFRNLVWLFGWLEFLQ